jgi:hypothetical protein
VCVHTIQLYNIKDWVVIVYRRRKKFTAEYRPTKRLDWRQRRKDQRPPESKRPPEGVWKTAWGRILSEIWPLIKRKGYRLTRPQRRPQTPTPTPVIETPADAPVFTGKRFIIKFTKRNGVRTKKYHYRKLGTAEVVEFMTKNLIL